MCDSSILLCLKKRFHLGRIYVWGYLGRVGGLESLSSGSEGPLALLELLPSLWAGCLNPPWGPAEWVGAGDRAGEHRSPTPSVPLLPPCSDESICFFPQTFGGPLLLSLNPHQPLPLFSAEVLASYHPKRAPNTTPYVTLPHQPCAHQHPYPQAAEPQHVPLLRFWGLRALLHLAGPRCPSLATFSFASFPPPSDTYWPSPHQPTIACLGALGRAHAFSSGE